MWIKKCHVCDHIWEEAGNDDDKYLEDENMPPFDCEIIESVCKNCLKRLGGEEIGKSKT